MRPLRSVPCDDAAIVRAAKRASVNPKLAHIIVANLVQTIVQMVRTALDDFKGKSTVEIKNKLTSMPIPSKFKTDEFANSIEQLQANGDLNSFTAKVESIVRSLMPGGRSKGSKMDMTASTQPKKALDKQWLLEQAIAKIVMENPDADLDKVSALVSEMTGFSVVDCVQAITLMQVDGDPNVQSQPLQNDLDDAKGQDALMADPMMGDLGTPVADEMAAGEEFSMPSPDEVSIDDEFEAEMPENSGDEVSVDDASAGEEPAPVEEEEPEPVANPAAGIRLSSRAPGRVGQKKADYSMQNVVSKLLNDFRPMQRAIGSMHSQIHGNAANNDVDHDLTAQLDPLNKKAADFLAALEKFNTFLTTPPKEASAKKADRKAEKKCEECGVPAGRDHATWCNSPEITSKTFPNAQPKGAAFPGMSDIAEKTLLDVKAADLPTVKSIVKKHRGGVSTSRKTDSGKPYDSIDSYTVKVRFNSGSWARSQETLATALKEIVAACPALLSSPYQQRDGYLSRYAAEEASAKKAGQQVVVNSVEDVPLGSYMVSRESNGAIASHKIEKAQMTASGQIAIQLALHGWKRIAPGTSIEVTQLGGSPVQASSDVQATEPVDVKPVLDSPEAVWTYIEENASQFEDANVAELVAALNKAGFSREVVDAGVSELLGPDATQALGTPVKVLLEK